MAHNRNAISPAPNRPTYQAASQILQPQLLPQQSSRQMNDLLQRQYTTPMRQNACSPQQHTKNQSQQLHELLSQPQEMQANQSRYHTIQTPKNRQREEVEGSRPNYFKAGGLKRANFFPDNPEIEFLIQKQKNHPQQAMTPEKYQPVQIDQPEAIEAKKERTPEREYPKINQNFNRFINSGLYDRDYHKIYVAQKSYESQQQIPLLQLQKSPMSQQPVRYTNYQQASRQIGGGSSPLGMQGIPQQVVGRHGMNVDHKKDQVKINQDQQHYNMLQKQQSESQRLTQEEKQYLERSLLKQNLDFGEQVPKQSQVNPRIHPDYSSLKKANPHLLNVQDPTLVYE